MRGAVLLYYVSTITSPGGFFWVLLAYAMCYNPTLALVNAISFNQMASAQGFITLVTYGVGMLIGTWVSGPVVDMYASGPADAVVHNWTSIWLWPAAMAFVIILIFAFFFRDEPQPSAST